MNRVSVVIPTYNRAKYIEKSIRSILNQTFLPNEIIVIDDGSQDDTKSVIDKIHDPRIIYTYQENAGAGAARNKGVSMCKGEWIAFCDSDDEWVPDKIEKQMGYAAEHPEYDMIYSAYSLDFIKYKSRIDKIPADSENRKLEGEICTNLIIQNSIGTPTLVVKKSAFDECRGFDERLRCIEDWEFVVRFSKKHLIGYIDEILVRAHRVDDESVSAEYGEMFNVRCQMIVENKQRLLEEGKFSDAVLSLFQKAEELGCLEQVKKMIMIYLQ